MLSEISMTTNEERLDRIEERLDLIAGLLLLGLEKDKLTKITDQIAVLADRGMPPTEISRIVGRSANYVNVVAKRVKKGLAKDA